MSISNIMSRRQCLSRTPKGQTQAIGIARGAFASKRANATDKATGVLPPFFIFLSERNRDEDEDEEGVETMGVLSNRIEREELKPGDHIYSWRTAYIYAHHGIYIGDGMVIHFTRAAGQEIATGTFLDKLFLSFSPIPTDTICEECGDQSKLYGVIRSCIDCFLAGGNLYIFKYAVSPAFFIAKARGGTCTLAASDPPEEVICRAKSLLNKGFGMYNLFKNNCEDFAIYCKTSLLVETTYSIGRSGQLASLTAAASTFMSSPLRMLTTSAGGLVIVAGGMYSVGRFVADIGIRRDVIKIPVESLVIEAGTEEPQTARAETKD